MNNDISDTFMHVFWFQLLEFPLNIYLGLVSMQWKIHILKLLMTVFLFFLHCKIDTNVFKRGQRHSMDVDHVIRKK